MNKEAEERSRESESAIFLNIPYVESLIKKGLWNELEDYLRVIGSTWLRSTVNAIAPWFISTDLSAQLGKEKKKMLVETPLALLTHSYSKKVDITVQLVCFLASQLLSSKSGFTKDIFLEKERYIKDYDGGILMESKSDPKLPYIDLSTMIHRQRQLRSDLFFNSFYLKESGIPKRVCKLKDIPGLNDVMYTIGTVKMMCCETENSSAKGESVTDSGRGSQATDNVNGCFVLWQMVPRMWSLELVLSSGNKVMAVMETILSSFALEMLVPGHAVGKVMGRGRSKVDNIRKVNIRASIEISDTKSSCGDRVAVISGKPEQKRTLFIRVD
ncbi:histone acetyltransferase GCN5 isoform X2 [Tanacetum coccineum]